MPKKRYSKDGTKCQVTFVLPKDVEASAVNLCGDFNEWSEDAHGLKRLKDGTFKLTLSLPAGRSYRYRFLLDGRRWTNDPVADEYRPNPFGGEDGVVQL